MTLWSLAGGGSNGAWQAGNIYQRWENRERPDVVAGTSVGALNGIMVATGQIEAMKNLWHDISDKKVRKKRTNVGIGFDFLLHKMGLDKPVLAKWSNNPLKKMVKQVITGTVTLIPYYASVVRVGDGEPDQYISIEIPAGTLINADNADHYVNIIVASTAIPIVFDPVWIYDDMYFDGGVHHSSPIYTAIREKDITNMLAICCQPLENNAHRPTDIPGVASWTLDTLLAHRFYRDWEEFLRWNQAAEQAELIIDGQPIKYIEHEINFPDNVLGNALDFSSEKARKLFKQGIDYVSRTEHTTTV